MLAAVMTTVLVGALAFSIDYGVIAKERTDLQRAADSAALAAVQELGGAVQDLSKVRDVARAYVASNINNSFQVPDSDIEIGRFDPSQIYSNVVLLNTGRFDTVRITLREDGVTNDPVTLFFAPIFGIQNASVTVTATAALQKASRIPPGSDVLPFSVPQDLWNGLSDGDEWTAYGDGKLQDATGNDVPGNWGTVDIGAEGNSTDDLNSQILDGLKQSDLDSLYSDGRIPSSTHIDSSQSVKLSADTGLSSGLKQSVEQVHGHTKLVPIYDGLSGSLAGENVEFDVVGWGIVTVVDSYWGGEKRTHVRLRKSNAYHGELRPHPNLGRTIGVIEGAFTSPVLID